LPHLCEKILELTENKDISEEEKVDQQLLYFFILLRGLVECDASYLINYRQLIIKILDRTLNFKCVDVYNVSSIMMRDILKSLTSIFELEFNTSKDSGKPHITVLKQYFNYIC